MIFSFDLFAGISASFEFDSDYYIDIEQERLKCTICFEAISEGFD